MEGLPKEINAEIFKHLTGDEIIKLCSTSKSLNRICSDDPKYVPLWRLKIEKEFGEQYNGDLAFSQYKFLHKLFFRSIYLVYSIKNYGNDPEWVGTYMNYQSAVE